MPNLQRTEKETNFLKRHDPWFRRFRRVRDELRLIEGLCLTIEEYLIARFRTGAHRRKYHAFAIRVCSESYYRPSLKRRHGHVSPFEVEIRLTHHAGKTPATQVYNYLSFQANLPPNAPTPRSRCFSVWVAALFCHVPFI
jgi:hypothetical protein